MQQIDVKRRRGIVFKAIRDTIDVLKRLNINARAFIDDKDNSSVFLVIDLDDIGKAIGRKIVKKLKTCMATYSLVDYFLVIIVRSNYVLEDYQIENVKAEIEKYGLIDHVEIKEHLYVFVKKESIANRLSDIIVINLKKKKINVKVSVGFKDNKYIVKFSK